VNLNDFNALPSAEAQIELERCCGASRWVTAMDARRPFRTVTELFDAAGEIWRALAESDWLEAFTHHPRIGDVDALRKRFAATRAWAAGEQAGAANAAEMTLRALADGNAEYEARFGYIFIICATGKSADEMLEFLHTRLPNEPAREIRIAAFEQQKITQIRLEKLLAS
jgi:2-oxo-4-hydroxy-4-carboxy-5-ureidoimidazoline decarboxylase